MLRAGVKLYELQRTQLPASAPERKAGVRSATGLHAKTFQIDDHVAFVGSFNFDPRSARINTEMGVVIESPLLAQHIASFFNGQITSLAYEVQLKQDGDLQWIRNTGEGPKVLDTEPGTSASRRAQLWLYSVLPIDGLL